MASPTLDLLCCIFRQGVNISNHSSNASGTRHPNLMQMVVLGYLFFASLFLSALVSIIGTAITLVPKKGRERTRREAVADDRQRIILSWLAAADLAACLGILFFALYCMLVMQEFFQDTAKEESQTESIICIIFTVWVQFFYLATYFWTLFYALDVYLMLKGVKKKFLFVLYFIVTWLLSALIIVLSLVALANSSRNRGVHCTSKLEDVSRNFSFFWGSYLTLLLVYVTMPVLYYLSSRMIKPLLQRSGGVYTDRERKVKAQIQKKFMRIIIVFIICWAPNIINGLLQFFLMEFGQETQWWNLRFIPLWLSMSILNPMQAFLNALVYWGPAGCTKVSREEEEENTNYPESDDSMFPGQMSGRTSLNTPTANGERTPLLRSVKL